MCDSLTLLSLAFAKDEFERQKRGCWKDWHIKRPLSISKQNTETKEKKQPSSSPYPSPTCCDDDAIPPNFGANLCLWCHKSSQLWIKILSGDCLISRAGLPSFCLWHKALKDMPRRWHAFERGGDAIKKALIGLWKGLNGSEISAGTPKPSYKSRYFLHFGI